MKGCPPLTVSLYFAPRILTIPTAHVSLQVAYFPDMYEAAGYPDMIARLEAQGEAKHSFAIHWLKYQVCTCVCAEGCWVSLST